jgi:hypothetical protein
MRHLVFGYDIKKVHPLFTDLHICASSQKDRVMGTIVCGQDEIMNQKPKIERSPIDWDNFNIKFLPPGKQLGQQAKRTH